MRDSLALIRGLPTLAALGTPSTATGAGEAWLRHGLARGQLHEVYAAGEEDTASAAGFAVAMALAAEAAPMIWLRTPDAERATGRLHATGLIDLGLSADALVMVVAEPGSWLRAAADAARCAGIGTLVMESWGPMPALDLTATRRLVLAAEASRVAVVSLRCRAEPVASAAAIRWRVSAGASAALEAGAPGPPVFDVELLRRRGGQAGGRWNLEWNRETRCLESPAETRAEAPVAGAGLSLAAGRPAARDSPAPVRARG